MGKPEIEAKDTVMAKEQIDELWVELWNWEKNEPPSFEAFSGAYAKRQAEITFKAGIEKGRQMERERIIEFLKKAKHCWKNEDEKERVILALEDN